jgi:hypothetical protein
MQASIPTMKDFLAQSKIERKDTLESLKITEQQYKKVIKDSGITVATDKAGLSLGAVDRSSSLLSHFSLFGAISAATIGAVVIAPTLPVVATALLAGAAAFGTIGYSIEVVDRIAQRQTLAEEVAVSKQKKDELLTASQLNEASAEQIQKSRLKLGLMRIISNFDDLEVGTKMSKGINGVVDTIMGSLSSMKRSIFGSLHKNYSFNRMDNAPNFGNHDLIANEMPVSLPIVDDNTFGGFADVAAKTKQAESIVENVLNATTEQIAKKRGVNLTYIDEVAKNGAFALTKNESYLMTYMGTSKSATGEKKAYFKTKSGIMMSVPSDQFDNTACDRKEKGKSFVVSMDSEGNVVMKKSSPKREKSKEKDKQKYKSIGD